MQNIVETAKSAGSFATLLTALEAAGLDQSLQGMGPFTVFAPNDEAFNKLPAGTVENLLKDEDKLKAILTYHVVPQKIMAEDVGGKKSLSTLQGSHLSVRVKDSSVWVDDAKVIKSNIECSNGVIHVIDSVVMPQ